MKKIIGVAACVAALTGIVLFVQAGDLEPPGPPAPTMKTLDQVEPRTPIHASDLPLTITSPGSYYLAEDISNPAGGITINSNNVTIDLMGFSFCGPGGRAIDAGTAANVTVKNGTICGWSSDALYLSHQAMVLNVRADQNEVGIVVGRHSVVSECEATNNNRQGFVLRYGSVITNSTASGNGIEGIMCVGSTSGGACTITGCDAYENGGHGIYAHEGSVIQNCTAVRNEGDGINAGSGATVRGCSSHENQGDGIEVYNSSLVVNNTCVDNAQISGDGAGIHATNASNRIDENLCRGNPRGIDVDFGGNFVVRNASTSNGLNYDIVPGNDVGPIESATTSTSPWANLD